MERCGTFWWHVSWRFHFDTRNVPTLRHYCGRCGRCGRCGPCGPCGPLHSLPPTPSTRASTLRPSPAAFLPTDHSLQHCEDCGDCPRQSCVACVARVSCALGQHPNSRHPVAGSLGSGEIVPRTTPWFEAGNPANVVCGCPCFSREVACPHVSHRRRIST